MMQYQKLNDNIGISIDLPYSTVMEIPSTEWKKLLHKHKLLVFKNYTDLSPVDITNFSKKFGIPWSMENYAYTKENSFLDENGVAYTVYNNTNYKKLTEEIPWHTDIANEPNLKRYPMRLLYCKNLPSHYEGLTTDVSNLVMAYNDLSESEKDFFSRLTLTYQSWSYPGTNIKDFPAIETHPVTNEKFLQLNFVNKVHGWIIEGHITMDDGTKTIISNKELTNIVVDKSVKYQYQHHWEKGDMMIWDNWGTIHKKGLGKIYDDSTGIREFIRLTIDNDFDTITF